MMLLVPACLYLLALAIRLAAATQLPFPATEPSAWYIGVAANMLAGDGLVSDAVWSYATPPLVAPKPAFELWQPMSAFVSAAGMAVLGQGLWAAQVAGALLGAFVAPLAWAIAREAAAVNGLDPRRGSAVALGAGLITAVSAPLILGSVVPDSYMPFTVFTLVAVLLVPRALGFRAGSPSVAAHGIWPGVGLGLAMGLAYLSRQESIWLGLTVLLMLLWTVRRRAPGERAGSFLRRLWPIVVGGLIVVTPWLIRNMVDLGSPFPGQAIENMFLTQNEDIFAFRDRPDASTYLGQGLASVLWNPVAAAWDALFNVISVTAFPIGLIGLVAIVGLRRSAALRCPTAILALLVSGGLTFVSTMLLFPVASLWGTFLHASGPLLVALAIMAALGGDALLARISELRHWERPNVILAPIALVAVTGLLAVFQLNVLAAQAGQTESRYTALAGAVEAHARDTGRSIPGTIITDHPMWVAAVLDQPAIALPDEEPAAVVELAERFGAPWIVLVGERGRYPDALLGADGRSCLAAEPVPLTLDGAHGWLFELAPACAQT